MLKNYLTITFRSLKKQRFFSAINILGLSVGVACCILIGLYVRHELSYDNYHSKAERIYRGLAELKFGEMNGKMAVMPAPLARTMVEDFPEVEAATRFRSWGSWLVKKGDEPKVREENVIWAERDMFDVFDFEVLEGNPLAEFGAVNTLVMTRRIAEKYFPDGGAVGEVLNFNDRFDFKIVGVIENPPTNTRLGWDIYLSMENVEDSKNQIWLSHNYNTYLVLAEGADPAALEAKFPVMLEKYAGPQVQQYLQISMDDWFESGNKLGYFLQPLGEIHLHSGGFFDDVSPVALGDADYVFMFSLIAVLILLIACINFMNLSTARSAQRAREVGVRKVLGSQRRQLIGQFLMESMMISFTAFVLAAGLAQLMLPAFNDLALKELVIPWSDPMFLGILLGAAVLVGLISGTYPAFYLSAFQPVDVLKGKLSSGARSGYLRSTLVVFQFAMSIILIAGTIIVFRQIQYVQNKKLGYDKEQILILQDVYTMKENAYALKEELKQLPGVKNASVSGFLPVPSNRNNNAFWESGKRTVDGTILMQNWTVDYDYLNTMGMEIVAGREFSMDFPTDSQAVILNESAARQFGYSGDSLDNVIGFQLATFTDFIEDTEEEVIGTWTVVGVVRDFHFESLKEGISALGMFIGTSRSRISLKLDTDDLKGTITEVEAKWKEFSPNQAINYTFLDDRFNRMYEDEARLGKIVGAFSLLAIFVACLGLFALSAFTAERRSKEIGIRKVMGATVSNIVLLLSREYAKLVLIALLISIPLVWWVSSGWLEGYQYHTEISWWIFALAGIMAILVAWVSVSFQSIRAALADPVRALKDE